jgi:hypothetical protein
VSKDLRRYASQTKTRLLIGFFLILVLVGIGSIYLLWGPSAAISGLVCIVMGLTPVVLSWILLTFLGWIARRANED